MSSVPQKPNVLIFGATSAIATEVAVLLAARGGHVHLVGRNPTKLAAVAARCVGAKVTTQCADFADVDRNAAIVATAIAGLERLDLALVAHGDLGDQLLSEQSFEEAERILRVNFTSVVSLLVPLARHMEAARTGCLAVVTSVAGDRGRPRNYTYGAAKGALNLYLQGLRTRLFPAGVAVTTLKLGPVDTPMTRDHAKNLLFAQPAQVGRGIVRAMDARVGEAYVPSFWRLIMPVVKKMPECLFRRFSSLSGR